MSTADRDALTGTIIGACIEVHRHLGPGLLESAYEECLCYELSERRLSFERQRPIPITYRGRNLDCEYRADVIVQDSVLLELKAVEGLLPIHTAQTLTYLKLTGLPTALLVNFHTPTLKQGIRRLFRPSVSGVAPLRVDSTKGASTVTPSASARPAKGSLAGTSDLPNSPSLCESPWKSQP
jgi:GxxExxY protein